MTRAPIVLRLFGEAVSLRVDRRVPAVAGALLLALAATGFVTLMEGSYEAPILSVLDALIGGRDTPTDLKFVVQELRLPRALVAALVGAAFALSGAVFQAVTRNPLADPGILGINSGAALAAVLTIVTFRHSPAFVLPFAAFGGALAATVFIYAFAWRGGIAPMRLILVGIGVAALLGALTTLVTTFGQIADVQRAFVWLSGSVYGRGWGEVWMLAAWMAVLGPLTLMAARRLDAMWLGDESAVGLGVRLEASRVWLIVLSTGLAASAVAAAGTLGFVGLVAPHVARRLVGPRHAGLLPVAALVGALLVLLADLAGRTIAAPAQLPAGLMTAILGAPYFVYLLWTRSKA